MRRSLKRFRESYFLHSFKRDKVAMISFAAIVIFIILATAAPWISPMNPYDANNIDIMNSEIPPAWEDEGLKVRIIWGGICFPPCSMGSEHPS